MDTFVWKDVSVSVPDNKNKGETKVLLENATGCVKPGQLIGLLGPSGSGKTTLLNILAQRATPAKSVTGGDVSINGETLTPQLTRQFTSYVEQEDSLIGSLTVRETIDYAAQLCGLTGAVRRERVSELLNWFGLEQQSNTVVGTAVKKGISGGQKRRVSVASQLITSPKVLFLDEPTSGLDSTASHMVISQLKRVAEIEGMMVIASIHQPSTSTLNLFDSVTFLSQGKTIYNGATAELMPYFDQTPYPIPAGYNPAEFILDLINVDFAQSNEPMDKLAELYATHAITVDSSSSTSLTTKEAVVSSDGQGKAALATSSISIPGQTLVLLKRLFIKSRRDVLAYFVRLAMYMGLSILMGTTFLRLGSGQENIQLFINAIFFSGAFMSFMAVAYIPAFLEDFAAYRKDSANGLYGPTAFLLSNFLIGLPFLFLITILFSVFAYFMVHFRPDAVSFWRFVMWLFLDLVAAESLVVLVSSIIPIFVVSLAIVAFANGLFMAVGGFLVSAKVLNVFWYYTFYWIDYQRYVFQGMMFNEFQDRVYDCDASCHCMFDSPLADQCKIDGTAVLRSLGYGRDHTGEWVGLMIVLIVVYRLLAWLALLFKARRSN